MQAQPSAAAVVPPMQVKRMRWLGAITPIGGVAMIAGWGCLILAAVRGS